MISEPDITQIGWNKDYIVYKRFEDGDKSHWGILNMEVRLLLPLLYKKTRYSSARNSGRVSCL